MPMHTLEELLSRVVERKGFAVQGADPEALFAKKGDEALLAAWKLDGPLSSAEATMFIAAMDQLQAKSGILVAPQGADQGARDAIGSRSVEIWAEARLVLEVGDAFVRDALDHPAATPAAASAGAASGSRYPSTPPSSVPGNTPTKFPSLVAQGAASVGTNHGVAYYMPNKKKEQPADMQATIGVQKGGSLGYAWGGVTGGLSTANAGIAQVRSGRNPSKKVDQWGNLIPPGQAAAAPSAAPTQVALDDVEIFVSPKKARAAQAAPAVAAPLIPMPKEDGGYEITSNAPKKAPVAAAAPQGPPAGVSNTLKVSLTKEDALAKSNAKPGAIVKLALVPHVAFTFDVHVEREGLATPMVGAGALLVSSLTGELRVLDHLDYSQAEPTDARKDQEKLQAVDLYEKVKTHMSSTFSKTVSMEKEIAGNTVMQNVKITPNPDEMGLEHRGIVYLPVWEITGGGVNCKIDAFTGASL